MKAEEDEAGEGINRGSWERKNIWDKGCGEVKEGSRGLCLEAREV